MWAAVKAALLGQRSIDAINFQASEFLDLRRALCGYSAMKHDFKPYDIFLSHAGEEKGSYAAWLPQLVEDKEQRDRIFLDETSLAFIGDRLVHFVAIVCRAGDIRFFFEIPA